MNKKILSAITGLILITGFLWYVYYIFTHDVTVDLQQPLAPYSANMKEATETKQRDAALNFMTRLKSDLGGTWNIENTTEELTFAYGENCSDRKLLVGYKIEDLQKNFNPNLMEYGFVTDIYNSGDATLAGATGLKRDSIICQYRYTYVPAGENGFDCFTDPTSDIPNQNICPTRGILFCADLNQLPEEQYPSDCEFRG